MKLVSACLAGIKCRWDGNANSCERIIELVKRGEALPVCPEQLAGLTTPRMPAEQKGGRVITKEGSDVTESFLRGAEAGLKIARMAGCREAILKARSPSCGCGEVYDGTFSKKLVNGDGVFAKLLKNNRIKVKTEEDL